MYWIWIKGQHCSDFTIINWYYSLRWIFLFSVSVKPTNKNTILRIIILADLTINTYLQWQINLLELRKKKKKKLKFKFHLLSAVRVWLSFCFIGSAIYQILIWQRNFFHPSCIPLFWGDYKFFQTKSPCTYRITGLESNVKIPSETTLWTCENPRDSKGESCLSGADFKVLGTKVRGERERWGPGVPTWFPP